jgi:hypothetical protein
LIKLGVVDTFFDLAEELGFSCKPLWLNLNLNQLRQIGSSKVTCKRQLSSGKARMNLMQIT